MLLHTVIRLERIGAGWSSLVARKVHILEVVSSNLTSATKLSVSMEIGIFRVRKDSARRCSLSGAYKSGRLPALVSDMKLP